MGVHPESRIAETRNLSPSQIHPESSQLKQPRSTVTSKFNDQTLTNNILPNNLPNLSTTSLGPPIGVDSVQMNVLHVPRVYDLPVDQSGDQIMQVPVISIPNSYQYPQMIPGDDVAFGNAPRNFQHVPNLRVPYTPTTVLSMAPSSTQHNTFPVDQFLTEHITQNASGLLTPLHFPVGNVPLNQDILQKVHPLNFPQSTYLSKYQNTNMLLHDPRSQVKSHTPTIGFSPTTVKPNVYTERMEPKQHIESKTHVSQVSPLPGYLDYILKSPQKSEDESSTRSLTSNDIDDLIRRNEHPLWKNADTTKISRKLSTALEMNDVNLDEKNKTTTILESELDRYISNIRKLYQEHGMQSLEEPDHEQNTSGDLLNVTLSEDTLAPLPTEANQERVPKQMEKIPLLVSDLASETADVDEIVQLSRQNGDDNLSAEQRIENEIKQIIQSNVPELKEERETLSDERDTRGILAFAKNEIREDVAPNSRELEQLRTNTEITKHRWNNPDLYESSKCEQETFNMTKNAINEDKLKSDSQIIASNEKQLDLVIGKESDIEGLFDIAEELEPWDLASMQTEIQELRLDDLDENGTVGRETEEIYTSDRVETTVDKSHGSLQKIAQCVDDKVENLNMLQDPIENKFPLLEIETKPSTKETEFYDENKAISSVPERNENSDEDRDLKYKINESDNIASHIETIADKQYESDNKKQKEEYNNMSELHMNDESGNVEENNEYNIAHGYIEDSNQAQAYEPNPNEQYNYNQNLPYERSSNEEYERFGSQGYVQEGQEYLGQYMQDPNNQQYQHDPNAQYQQDPNQVYDYSYDQQYDPNQGYVNDPNQEYGNDPNQVYSYPENVSYDPNQTYDNIYQEYKEEQYTPSDDIINTEYTAERQEIEEVFTNQVSHVESEHKSDGNNTEQEDSVKDTSQPIRKKDVINSLLDSDTDTTIERNVSNTESDFDFN